MLKRISAIYRAGIIPTTLALRTTLFLIGETEYMPWESALDNLDYFYLMFDRTELYGPMQVSFVSGYFRTSIELSLNSNITLFQTCRHMLENRWNLCLNTIQILQIGRMCQMDILTSKSCTYRDDKSLDLLSSLYSLYSCLCICRYNQVNALRVACSTGLENCTTLVKDWFQQWMENPNNNP